VPAAGAEQQKPTTWSTDSRVYAFYSEKLLSKPKEHFKTYKDSKKYHVRHGMCQNASRAETHGPLIVGLAFCACAKCLELKYDECLVKQHSGQVRTVEVPKNKGERAVETQASALSAFVAGVTANSTWAVAAAEDSRSSEGRYWLARIIEEPYQNPQAFMQFGKATSLRRSTGTGASGVGSSGRSKKNGRCPIYPWMNAVIRTDGAVKMTKPPSGKREEGELDLSSEE